MLKTILLTIIILLFSNIASSQEQPTIELIETVKESTFILSFENQRDIDINKMERFTSRLVNYYDEVNKINYNSEDNLFTIYFSKSPSELDYTSDFLSHFNVYNFTIKK